MPTLFARMMSLYAGRGSTITLCVWIWATVLCGTEPYQNSRLRAADRGQPMQSKPLLESWIIHASLSVRFGSLPNAVSFQIPYIIFRTSGCETKSCSAKTTRQARMTSNRTICLIIRPPFPVEMNEAAACDHLEFLFDLTVNAQLLAELR